MFKKAAQIVVTFSLLTGAYLGYARGFALLAARVGQAGGPDETNPFPESPARSALLALQYARESLGETHWTAGEKLPLQWYDALHGHYIYAENYERLDEGKRLRVWKFALIWISKDGKSRKVATSDEAVIDMSQPIGIVGGGKDGSMHIVHARMTGNVKLRDDKGTKDLDDDLRVALNYVEYDESTLQITSDSPIRIEDRDVLITGLRMMIQLRKATPAGPGKPASGGSGFDAESMVLYKNVDITSGNATSTGILPGASKPDAKGNTPLKLTCDGQMTIVMPRPRPFVETGPPDLNREPDPTLAYFQTNVQVVRGTTTPDQLNCDTLDLTLMPVAQGGQARRGPAAPADAPSGGPLTDSQLTRAVARGHAVWIQSESQGLKARCLELIHDKHTKEGEADRTYLNGGPTKQLWMEKVDLAPKGTDRAGTIESVRTVNALDATIFEYGNETSKVIGGRARQDGGAAGPQRLGRPDRLVGSRYGPRYLPRGARPPGRRHPLARQFPRPGDAPPRRHPHRPVQAGRPQGRQHPRRPRADRRRVRGRPQGQGRRQPRRRRHADQVPPGVRGRPPDRQQPRPHRPPPALRHLRRGRADRPGRRADRRRCSPRPGPPPRSPTPSPKRPRRPSSPPSTAGPTTSTPPSSRGPRARTAASPRARSATPSSEGPSWSTRTPGPARPWARRPPARPST